MGGLSETHTGAELSVFLLEFDDPALEVGELSLAAVAGVLCSDTVAVSSCLFAILRRGLCASTFAGGAWF